MSSARPRAARRAAIALGACTLGACALDATLLGVTPLGAQPTAAPAPSIPLTFTGEVRSRSEWDHPGGSAAADAFTYLRSRFGVRAEVARGASFFLQLQDSRVLGAEGNTTVTAPDVFDLHQGYAELAGPLGATRASVRAGRQEIVFGNERLVGAGNWTNTGRSFDGVRLSLAPRTAKPGAEPWTTSLFAATVEERGRRFGATAATTATSGAGVSPSPRDHAAVGLFATRTLGTSALGATALDATALYDGGGKYRSYDGANRTTVDVRVRQPRLFGARAELEGAYQFGTQRYVAGGVDRHQAVRAWLLGARLGTPAAATTRASATIGVDMLSGDVNATDGTYGAFNTMYATNHPFYGFMDLFSDPAARTKDRGLVDAKVLGAYTLTSAVGLRAELHRFGLATGSTRSLGWEADAVAPLKVGTNAVVDLGYGVFRAGAAAAAAGLGGDGALRNWAYLQLRVGF